MATGHFHASRDEDAARALLNRARGSRKFREYVYGQRFRVSRDFDIPYLAGYSISGKIIYVDRHLPLSILIMGRRINILPFLITHERTEKGLIDILKQDYIEAHNAATLAEHDELKQMRVSPTAYERALDPYIKADLREKILRTPADLDLKPYRDSRDIKLIERIESRMVH